MRKDFHLVTLGRLSLEPTDGDEDAGLNRQRRKLAVLCVLALARGPVSRDVLLEMFWGDQVGPRARHSLSDALSHLRRVLGAGAVTARHAEVALDAGAPLSVDALQFAEAAGSGDDERALALYQGSFLAAVYVGGSARFEQWVEREALRLERLFCAVCERRCEALAEAGDWPASEAVARRWVDADPLSTDAALALLSASRGAGDREGDLRALAEYRRLRERVTREIGVDLDPRVVEFAALLESRAGRSDAGESSSAAPQAGLTGGEGEGAREVVVDAESRSPESRAAAADDEVAAPGSPGAPLAERHPRGEHVGRARPPRRRVFALALAVVAAALVLPLLPAGEGASTGASAGSPPTLAVFPFSVHGAPEFGYLREGMVDLLSTNLDGAAGLRTIDPRAVLALAPAAGEIPHTADRGQDLARRLGASIYILGDVVEAGGRLRVSAALYDAAGGHEPLSRAYAEGVADSLFVVVDALTMELLAERAQRIGGRIARLATLTTSSIPALKAYLEGERHWRAVRLVEAVDALRRATQQDTAFALAWYRLGMASSWDARVTVAEEAMDRAVRHSALLSERDRMLITAYRDVVERDVEGAERLYRQVVAGYPADVEAWAGLAEMWFHGNPWRGRSFEESRPAWERVLSLEPHNVGAMWHLAYVSARQGRGEELDSLTRRIQATVAGDSDLSVRTIRSVALGSAAEREALLPALRAADDFSLILAVWRAAVATDDLAVVVPLTQPLIARDRPSEVRALGHALRAHLRLGTGQRNAARADLDSLAVLDPAMAIEYRALIAVHPMFPADSSELRAVRDVLRGWDGSGPGRRAVAADLWINVHADLHPLLRHYLLGLVAARLGSERETEEAIARLTAVAVSADAAGLVAAQLAELRAELQLLRGRPDAALAALEAHRDAVDYGLARVSPFFARSRQRFLRAELLRQLGREAEAVGWYRGLGEIYPFDAIYLGPASQRLAAIHRARGDDQAASAAIARFRRLWQDADPARRSR